MWGEIVLGLLSAASASVDNDANNTAMEIQSQYQLAIEQERTRQKQEETKREIINGIIGGVFDVLSSAANANSGTNTNKN